MSDKADPPLIVLVRPKLGENIGKAARAMLNFGLTELRLVEPRDGWPNPSAGPAAAGADEVLARAQVFPTLADAVADCAHVYATTVRKRGVTKPVFTPEEAAQAIHRDAGRSALVFGPERSGLDTEDVALACRKRGIAQERLDQLVSGVQRQIETMGEAEVPASAIGEMVMEGLRQLDSVAYIRFASVYREFSEARDFEEFAGSVRDVGQG